MLKFCWWTVCVTIRVACLYTRCTQNSAAGSIRSSSLYDESAAAPAPLSTADATSMHAAVQQVLAQQHMQQNAQGVDVQRLLAALLHQQAGRAEQPVATSRGTSQATSAGAGATPRHRGTVSPSPGDWDPLYSDEQLLGEEKKGGNATPPPDGAMAAAMDVSPVAAIAQERMQAMLLQQQQQQLLLSMLAQQAPAAPAQQVGWQGPVAGGGEGVEAGVRKRGGEEGGLKKALREAQQGQRDGV